MKILNTRWFIALLSLATGCLGTLLICFIQSPPTHFPAHPFLFLLAVSGLGIMIGPLYFLPTIIGLHKRNALAICLLNGLLGWTFLGWVAALIWAVLKEGQPVFHYESAAHNEGSGLPPGN